LKEYFSDSFLTNYYNSIKVNNEVGTYCYTIFGFLAFDYLPFDYLPFGGCFDF
jgi:hypothetical protein